EKRTQRQMLRSYNRPSATAATHLFAPRRRRQSKTRGCSLGSCRGVAIHRKSKFKPSTTIIDIFSCNCAAVRFNDRTHNSQAHSQPFSFSTAKRIEQPVTHILRNPDAMITHTGANCAIPIRLSLDEDLALGGRRVSHRVERVDHKIQ